MRKNWKRLSALLLALVMVLSLVPVTALAARREDDAAPMLAPDTAVDKARPAGAVDAEDVPATLAEGATNIAKDKIIEALNKDGEADTENASTESAGMMVDGDPNTRWASVANMKADGENGAAADPPQPKTVIIDLGENCYATGVNRIKIAWYLKVWAKDYTISTAATKDTADWTTIYTLPSRDDSSNNAVTDDITLESVTLQRFVKFYFQNINLSAGGSGISINEIEIYGTLNTVPAEPGDGPAYTYANIESGLFDVGATVSGNATDGWTASYSNAGISASAASYENDSSATLAVDGNPNTKWHTHYDGGTGEGLTNSDLPSHPEARYIQIDLNTAVELSALRYLPSNKVQWVNGIITRYEVKVCTDDTVSDSSTWTTVATADDTTNWDAAFTDANASGENWYIAYFNAPVTTKHVRLYAVTSKSDGHNPDSKFITAREVRLVKAGKLVVEVPEYNTVNINAGLFDVGANPRKHADGTWTANYSNPSDGNAAPAMNGTVIKATAESYRNAYPSDPTTGQTDGIPYLAVDGYYNNGNKWHTNYQHGGTGVDEGEWGNAENSGKRYIQLEIVDGAMDLVGLRYIGNDSNGWISKYYVTVSTDGENWTEVARGTWDAPAVWQYAEFNQTSNAKYVRLYSNPDSISGNWYINAREIRLVKAPTDTHTITGTVKNSSGAAIAGATVSVGNKSATTGSDGAFSLEGLSFAACNATVTMNGYKTREVEIAEDADNEIKLYAALSDAQKAPINDHLWDYPIWADVTDNASATPRYSLNGSVHGGSVTAFCWEYHDSNQDLPPWAAIDGNNATHWHTRYGSTGQAAAADNVGRWYEFTLEQPTKIIGLWYMRRSNGDNQPGNVTVKVSTAATSPTSAEWDTLPSAGSGNMTESGTAADPQNWVFVELAAPVEAKHVRIYSSNNSHIVIAELRVVMDPETSGAKHLAGAVTASIGGAAIEGATLKVANHTATSGANGAYDLGYLTAGTYSVTASAPGYRDKTQEVTIGADGELEPVAITLETQPLTLNVTVTAGGQPVDGATVTLERNNTGKLPVAGVAAATSGTNGVYTVDATQAGMGTFVARVSHPDYNIGTTNVTFNNDNTTVSATVALTARSAPADSGGELVKEYDFSDASQVADFVALATSGGATVEHDAEKGAMKITFVDDATSYKNLILNKKFVIKNGSFEFDVTAEGTVAAAADFGTVFRYGDGKWLHVGQLNAVDRYGATTHTSATESASYTGNVTSVAIGNGVTRRFNSMLGLVRNGAFVPHRSALDLESAATGWRWDHTTAQNGLAISNDVGLWGFDAKNAGGLVVYIDNLKVYRRTEQKGEVTIGALSDGTLTVKTVTELDTEGTALTSGDNAFEGDTVKISATDVPEGKVFAVKVTRTSDGTTVVPVTKGADGSFTFAMPAYGVTITPAAATQLTDVTVTGAEYGEATAKYARVGNTLTVSEGTTWGDGVSYQWQYSADGTNWANIANATGASFALTGSQYNGDNAKNQVRVVVTGNDVAYTGTVESAAVDVKEALVDVTGVTFARSNITMWSNYDSDPVSSNGSEEGNTTTITATITPSTASRPLSVTWESSDTAVISISEESTTATEVTTETGTALTVSAKLTAHKAGSATITCTVTAKDSEEQKVATVNVTAKTAVTEITLTSGGKTLASAEDVLTIYANAEEKLGTDEANSVDVTATVNEGASATGLGWACNHVGEHIFVLGGDDKPGEAAGTSVTISAYDSHELVGTETVTVTAPASSVPTGVTPPSKTFTVKVVHKIDATEHSVSITGTPKVGNTLSVNLNNVPATVSSDKLDYQWKRTKTVDGATTTENIGTGKTYPLTPADVGATITVTVTAKTDSYYAGSLTSAATKAVEMADGPDAPTLTATHINDTNATGTISISSDVEGAKFEYRKSTDTAWTPVEGSTITNLEEATYQVRIQENTETGTAAGTVASIAIEDNRSTYHDVEVQADADKGTVEAASRVKENETATLTVKPKDAYTIQSVTANGTTLTGTAGEDGKTVYTVSNVTGKVTFVVTYVKKQVTITLVLTNVTATCDAGGSHTSNDTHTVEYGTVEAITLTVTDEYILPTTVQVTETDSEGNLVDTDDKVSYENGVITFEDGVTADITITATATAKTFNASFNPSTGGNLTREVTSTTPIAYNGTLTATLTPAAGYSAPAKENVQVTVGGTAAEFTYAVGENGVATITVANVKGNVVIKADSAVKDTTPLDSVSIEIGHDDSNVSNQDVPHVGDTLTAKPVAGDKTNVIATYEWYVGGTKVEDLQDPSHETYTVRAGDKGKKIKVVATGDGDFSGTVTSAETEAVGDKVYAVTGVKIQKDGSDVAAATPIPVTFGGTLQLTAVISPSNATNKNVTWSSSSESVATVASNGLVTAKGVGEATITVTTEDGSLQATCKVQVTAKDLTSDDTATVRVGGTLELGQTVNAVLVPADAANGASYSWSIVNADGSNETPIMDTDGASATLPTDSSNLGKKVKLVVTYGGNYTGTKTRITQGVIAGELPTHAIRIDSDIANGSVTANLTEAKMGVTVTLTVTPNSGYELETLTVTAGNYGTPVETDKVNDTTYTFIMPDTLADSDAVNVTATFAVKAPTPSDADTAALAAAIDAANEAKEGVEKIDGKTASEVEQGKQFVTTAQMDDFEAKIAAAQTVMDKADATQEEVDSAATALATATTAFQKAIKTGTKAPTYAITISATTNGTVTADKAEAAEGVTVTLTVTPNGGYKLTDGTLKVTKADSSEITVTANKFTMPGEAVTVSASFELDGTPAEALTKAIEAAKAAKDVPAIKSADTDPSTVNKGTTYVTQEDVNALEAAITAAEAVKDKADATDEELTQAIDALNGAVDTFKAAIKTGTKQNSSSRPSTSTEPPKTEVKEDGTKVTTETKPDGTKVETVESPDGTTAVTETKPDGTVTETVTDAEGVKTEKVTDPEENVTITVTDAEGEELAKVELPATVKEPETKFEDIEGHWAEESINKVAALGLVNGVGNNKYGTESSLTRGQLATVLYRLSNGKSGYRVTFSDVEIGQYYTDGVAWAARAGVVKGISEDIFAPNQIITREQLATMLCRYAKLIGMDTTASASSLNAFTDGGNTDKWAVDGVAWCVENGILRGTGAETLAPTSNVTRAQVAVMLDRFIALIK